MAADSPDIRIGTAEREQAMQRLSDHFAAGRLSVAEFDERSGVVAAAVTRGDLAKVFTDLPEPVVAPPVSAGPVQRRPGGPRPEVVVPAVGIAVVLAVVLFLATHLWFWFLLIPVIVLARAGRSPNDREHRRREHREYRRRERRERRGH
ncbi:DUF1707 domain-containing protein [Nocardia sp. BMG111209]|uniref:DUF1707 SHOCT-like domain-containing protein n=1 Tax=Nocardia sp. BMG111209 TaxID=1160137 RepID=UPI000375A845|nr:DUF1707 domain-containing protein [Nocardia sp. BMG111209]